jgi:hypothetical protein
VIEPRRRTGVLALVILDLLDEAFLDRFRIEGQLVNGDARPGSI